MNFEFTEQESAILESARQFAEKEMAPYAAEWDKKHIFPVETLQKAAQLGFATMYVTHLENGGGLTRLESALVFEELATACPSTAAYLSIHNMVAALIDKYADSVLRDHWLPKLATMECFSSYCLTEPDAGSDAASLTTSAIVDGDHYVVNGAKAFISGGSTSDIYICMVRTGEAGPRGITCLLIEKTRAGIHFGKREEKLGWHSQPTTMVFFENCRVPISNRIGNEGDGFKIALSALNGGRINIAACSLGGAKQCIKLTKQYLLERKQFKQALADFEALQFRFADMVTEWEAARLMTYRAACALDQQHPDLIQYCAMAKRFATDLCFQICNQALQLHGGYGYLQDYPIERFFRDLRVHQILEGTNEIMRLIIAKQMLANN